MCQVQKYIQDIDLIEYIQQTTE